MQPCINLWNKAGIWRGAETEGGKSEACLDYRAKAFLNNKDMTISNKSV